MLWPFDGIDDNLEIRRPAGDPTNQTPHIHICVHPCESVSEKMMNSRAFCDSHSYSCAASSPIRIRTKCKMQTARRLWITLTAREHSENFRQDLQGEQDLNIGLQHLVQRIEMLKSTTIES